MEPSARRHRSTAAGGPSAAAQKAALAAAAAASAQANGEQRKRPASAKTAAADGAKPKKRSVRYLREDEMEAHVAAAAREQGLDDSAAKMIAACSRNIYALGCLYHPDTVARIASVCSPAAKAGAKKI